MKVTVLPPDLAGDPEVTAMLQAFYSRSNMPIAERLDKLRNEANGDTSKIREALSRYYVGYGHKSIGQCGTITIFIEDVSMIAAKAVQHHPLYNGQECSTRYLDFSTPAFYDQVSDEVSATVHEWYRLYDEVRTNLVRALTATFGNPLSASEARAINAYAFDRARGWLPAAAYTKLSWHTQFDNLEQHLAQMLVHPFKEVRDLAVAINDEVSAHYPVLKKVEPASAAFTVWDRWDGVANSANPRPLHMTSTVRNYLLTRKKHDRLPFGIGTQWRTMVNGQIDFGTWRDLQRHRNGAIEYTTPRHDSFHRWYMEQLAELALDEEFIKHVHEFTAKIAAKDFARPESMAYAAALGSVVQTRLNYGLDELLYVIELRTGHTVHPVLREFMQHVAQEYYLEGFANMEPSKFELKRGDQTILKIE